MKSSQTLKLPNEPIFNRLIGLVESPSYHLICDSRQNVRANSSQLLADINSTRQSTHVNGGKSLFDKQGRIKRDTPYVFVLSSGNYEFIVASLSILALGGAIVPLPTKIMPEEAFYLAQKCKATCILAGNHFLDMAAGIKKFAQSQGQDMAVLPVSTIHGTRIGHLAAHSSVLPEIDSKMKISPRRPSLLLFTSGTSGPPKGVVNLRNYFYYDHLRDVEGTFLCHHAPFWSRGLILLLKRPLSGHRIEIVDNDPKVVWETLRDRRGDALWSVPRFWASMQKYFNDHLKILSPDDLAPYIAGAKALRIARIGATAAPAGVLEFWKDLLGRPLSNSFAATELGGMGLCLDETMDSQIWRSVGKPDPGVEVKLSEGDHGEMSIKSPVVFSHYLDDLGATNKALDQDGYFRTGDYARRVGTEYVVEGRINTDFIQWRGLRIPILEVESVIMDLPYVAEAAVVSVDDADASKQIAALIRLESHPQSRTAQTPLLHRLRVDLLSKGMEAYKLPNLLRILEEDGDFPRTASGKIVRKKTATLYFPLSDSGEFPVQVEVCRKYDLPDGPQKLWDWAGLQE